MFVNYKYIYLMTSGWTFVVSSFFYISGAAIKINICLLIICLGMEFWDPQSMHSMGGRTLALMSFAIWYVTPMVMLLTCKWKFVGVIKIYWSAGFRIGR